MDNNLIEFISASEKELSKRQASIVNEKQKIINLFEKLILSQTGFENTLLQSRVKSPSSLKEKIIRKNYFNKFTDQCVFIDNLPDLIGLRMVCFLDDDEITTFNLLKNIFTEDIGDGFNVIPESSNGFPYLTINFSNQPDVQKNTKKIFRIPCRWITSEKDSIKVELQIKSLIHMFWGEIEHMLIYKNYSNIIGAGFYQQLMNSTFELLGTVEYQLKIMKEQLYPKNTDGQIEEIKQILIKLMHSTYESSFKDLICTFDLREIYESIIRIRFQNINTIDLAINETNSIISQLNSKSKILNEDSFKFEPYKENDSILCDDYKPLAKIICRLIIDKDLRWQSLVAIYMLISAPSSFTQAIDDLTVKLMSFLTAFSDNIENLDFQGKKLFKKGIITGIIQGFSYNNEIQYFSNDQISIILLDLVDEYQDYFELQEELSKYNTENIVSFVGFIVSLQIRSSNNITILLDELVKLSDWYKLDLPWKPEINKELLESLIKSEITISENSIEKLFKKSGDINE